MFQRYRPPLGALVYFLGAIMMRLYFTFAAVQGEKIGQGGREFGGVVVTGPAGRNP